MGSKTLSFLNLVLSLGCDEDDEDVDGCVISLSLKLSYEGNLRNEAPLPQNCIVRRFTFGQNAQRLYLEKEKKKKTAPKNFKVTCNVWRESVGLDCTRARQFVIGNVRQRAEREARQNIGIDYSRRAKNTMTA